MPNEECTWLVPVMHSIDLSKVDVYNCYHQRSAGKVGKEVMVRHVNSWSVNTTINTTSIIVTSESFNRMRTSKHSP